MKFNEEKVSKLEFARQAMLESLAMNRNPLMELINFFFFTKDLSNPIKLTALVLGIMGSDRKSWNSRKFSDMNYDQPTNPPYRIV